jgi:endonuclease YncB( thermonuclease family)
LELFNRTALSRYVVSTNRRNPRRYPARLSPFKGRRPPNRRLFRKKDPAWFKLLMVALPLAAASAVYTFDGPPSAEALSLSFLKPLAAPVSGTDRESGSFGKCRGMGWNCVIDGDTIRYHGEKIRIADINTPETFEAQCASERDLGNAATARMIDLLNQGAFTLEPIERETDKYGRTLRVITRGGTSLGETLVAEGLAERWKGYRSGWC